MKFFIAGPLKFESTRTYLDRMEETLRRKGFSTFSPYKDIGIIPNEDLNNPDVVNGILEEDILALHECDGAIFLLDGVHAGTIFELGYVYCMLRNDRDDFVLIGLHTSVRGRDSLDPMLRFCFEDKGVIVNSLSELEELLSEIGEG